MKKNWKLITCLCVSAVTIATLGACATANEDAKLEKAGKVISVTYDANGGKVFGRTSVVIKDRINPNDITDTDQDGVIEFKLTSPEVRKNSLGVGADIKKDGYYLAGWYKTRTDWEKADGTPLDEFGNEISYKTVNGEKVVGDNGRYVCENAKGEEVTQGYSYTDPWDFSTDKLSYTLNSGKLDVTFYAAWLPQYTFNYMKQNTEGVWETYHTESFGYKTTQDTIYMPTWIYSNASDTTTKITRKYEYSDPVNGIVYNFPTVEGYTFNSAYTDESCTQEIAEKTQHIGAFDLATGTPTNVTQNIYVKFDEGEFYNIYTAKEFATYGNKAKECTTYNLKADLDFANDKWPANLSTKEFKGVLNGENHTVSNVTVQQKNTSDTFGGLFGKLGANAKIQNVTFDNVNYEFTTGAVSQDEVYFGIFAGLVETGATVANVTMKNATMTLGKISANQNFYKVGLVTGNGIVDGLTTQTLTLKYRGTKYNGDNNVYFFATAEVDTTTYVLTLKVVGARSSAEKVDVSEFGTVTDNVYEKVKFTA